jgi:acyl-CoA synthetase (AMP-forming)/AMP-acid ligase II
MTRARVVYDELQEVVARREHELAMVGCDGGTWTYGQLMDAVDDAAAQLGAQLADGDVLGLAVEDQPTFTAGYLAAAQLGIVTVLLDSRLPTGTMEAYAAKYDICHLATDADRGLALHPAGDLGERRARAAAGYADDDFVVHCTSGSTGQPKGIVISQAAAMARVRHWSDAIEMTADDVVLCPLPLAHCYGIEALTLPALLRGATVVFARGGHLTGRGMAQRCEAHGVTVVGGLPLMYELLTSAAAVSPASLSTLRMAISGSAPLPLSTQGRFQERFGLPLQQAYGLAEIGVICLDRAGVGQGSVGTPIGGIEWRLDEVDATAAEAQEEIHELCVRGPAIARGYYRDPAASAQIFTDGWLRTHDLIAAGQDGWHIRGRRSGFINVAGNKVGPLAVEAALRESRGVLEAAVIGVPDPATSECVAALVVAGDGFRLEDLRRDLSKRLLSYELPQRYMVAASLPKTPLGKTDYAAVRALVAGDAGPAAESAPLKQRSHTSS